MTKKTEIICNHCQTPIASENGFGIHFTGNKYARTVPMKDAENHLCLDCAKGYHSALRGVLGVKDYIGIDQIKHMVDRFLGWRLPKPWNPDNGISYTRPNYAHEPADHDWPTGANLFDATQVDAMVRHMVAGLPSNSTPN